MKLTKQIFKDEEKIITRSSRHLIPNSLNFGKKNLLNFIIDEYQLKVQFFIDWLWDNDYDHSSKTVKKIWSRKNNLLNCPGFILTTKITNSFNEKLSASLLSSAANQACGTIKSTINQVKRLKAKKKLNNLEDIKKIEKEIESKFVKPNVLNNTDFKIEISSKNTELISKDIKNGFDLFLCLKGITRKLTEQEKLDGKTKIVKFFIPLNKTKMDIKFETDGFKRMNSFLISKKRIEIRYQKAVQQNSLPDKVGVDFGINSSMTFSTGEQSKKDIHGHDMKSICEKIARKQTNSKAHKKAKQHLINYINYDVKQFDYSSIGTINFEKIRNFKKSTKLTLAWRATLQEKALINQCELRGVRVFGLSSFYRSQRCSNCGWTCPSNRHLLKFSCKSCGFQDNADVNAAKNILRDDLCRIEKGQVTKGEGFFWTEKALSNELGEELKVPLVQNIK